MQHETSALPQIFDRALLARRHARAEKLGPEDFLLARIAEDMTERLSAVMREFTSGVDIATPGAHLARRLAERMPPLARADFAAGESLGLAPQAHDLALSALALHFVNDLPGALAQIRRALKPDGLLLASVLGGLTLHELRHAFVAAESETAGGASPRVAPFADVRDFGGLLQRAGFALPVADADVVEVAYPDAVALMRDVQAMGMSNALHERRRAFLRRDTLFRAAEIYAERFARPDGRVIATFEIITLTGWAPHPEQQQPLRPGSAKVRLAEALGVPERPAGSRGDGE